MTYYYRRVLKNLERRYGGLYKVLKSRDLRELSRNEKVFCHHYWVLTCRDVEHSTEVSREYRDVYRLTLRRRVSALEEDYQKVIGGVSVA